MKKTICCTLFLLAAISIKADEILIAGSNGCNWQIVMPDFGVLSGPFQISNLDYRGEHAGEITFDISLDSAGALSFTAN